MKPHQAERRVDICHQLIGNPMDERFIRKIVACDEKWVKFYASKQWLGPRQPAKVMVKKNQFGPKVMCVWWNIVGVIHMPTADIEPQADCEIITHSLY